MTRPPKDTLRFEAAASAHRCARGMVVAGAARGNGVLVWLRSPDSIVAGEWSLLQRADTVSPRGATVGVRFSVAEVVRGVALDSGSVWVARAGPLFSVTARGSGLEAGGAGRVAVQAVFESVPVSADSAPCRAQP